ncbi:MAG: DUF1266 domain-containing protein [Burkholderiaceae bacterium]|jgi:hypothetical protein|nr:DUF1266 domain-containing protein [Burkholderiaceae bacterium]
MPITSILVLYLLWRLARYLFSHRPRPRFTTRKHGALLLALPYAEATEMNTFFDASRRRPATAPDTALRAQLLHQMGLRVDASDTDARAHLERTFERQWFRMDLHTLQPTDEPRAALAFACARTAFFARAVMLMQWVAPEYAWRVLLLNAQRAHDCFESWEDYGRAFITGRRQWIAAFRADPFGKAFDTAALQRWLAPRSGVWSRAAWPGLPAFDPRPSKTMRHGKNFFCFPKQKSA